MSNSKDLVKTLYDTNLPSELKKIFVNNNLSLIEKYKIQKSICRLFKNYNEAFYYHVKWNKGQIYISKEERVEVLSDNEIDLFNYGIDPIDNGTNNHETLNLKTIIKVSEEEKLIGTVLFLLTN